MTRYTCSKVAGLLWLLAPASASAFQTITMDGHNDFDAADASESHAGATWYFEHDDAYLYVGLEADVVARESVGTWVTMYFDTDAKGGSKEGVRYADQQPELAMHADFHLGWSTIGTWSNLLVHNSHSGSWTDRDHTIDNLGVMTARSGSFVEFAIPLESIGSPGMTLDVFGAVVDVGPEAQTFHTLPATIPSGHDPDFRSDPHTVVLRAAPSTPSRAGGGWWSVLSEGVTGLLAGMPAWRPAKAARQAGAASIPSVTQL